MIRAHLAMRGGSANILERYPLADGSRDVLAIVEPGFLAVCNGDDLLKGGEKRKYDGRELKVLSAALFRESIDSKKTTEYVNQIHDLVIHGPKEELLDKAVGRENEYSLYCFPVLEIHDFVAFAHFYAGEVVTVNDVKEDLRLNLLPLINAKIQKDFGEYVKHGMDLGLAKQAFERFVRVILNTSDVRIGLENRGLLLRPESFNFAFRVNEEDKPLLVEAEARLICPGCGEKLSLGYHGQFCPFCGEELHS